jgi:hypothetical protein
MCGCKDCKEVTLLSGADGRGIVSITRNANGTFTYLFTDGSIYVTPNLTGAEGPQGEPGVDGADGINGNWAVVEYLTDPLGADTSGESPTFTSLSPFTYTVPVGTATTDYEVTFHATIIMTFDEEVTHQVYADIAKNNLILDPVDFVYRKGATGVTVESLPLAFNLTTSAIVSLAAEDEIGIYSASSKPSDAYLAGGIFKVTKLG